MKLEKLLEPRGTRYLCPNLSMASSDLDFCLAAVIGESGFKAQAGRIIVSGYSGVCFENKFSGRHRGFDGVLFNL